MDIDRFDHREPLPPTPNDINPQPDQTPVSGKADAVAGWIVFW